MEDSRYLPNQTELNLAQQDELKQELLKYYKTSLIIGLLKQPEAPISTESRALLAVYRHDEELPLGLDHIRNVEISYHERNAINKYIETSIIEQVRPYVETAKQFTEGNLGLLADSQYHEQHTNLQLDHNRQQLLNELAQLKARKIQLMKACAEIRTGPYQRNNVELKYAEACFMATKTKMLQKLTANEIVNCTPHAVKAVQEVAAVVKTLIGDGN
uniref:Uncharacterized protein n=1 Tax=Anopheles farauti TaxID=69004 RepID=A0A182QWB0_9DIPT